MKMRFSLMLAAALFFVHGCCTTQPQPFIPPPPPRPVVLPAPCDRCGPNAQNGRFAPVPFPPGPMQPPPAPGAVNQSPPVQPGSFPSASQFEPSDPRAYDSGVRLSAPEALFPESARFAPPQTTEPPLASPPLLRDDHEPSPPLPVDIPQFAMAKDRVAAGLQPFPDGVRWLADHRYRTVLYVRAPGEDDSIARRVFEKRGLNFLSLEVSPTTLSRDVVDRFGRIVADENGLPLFVYDKDGSLAGALWYLHFRTAEGASDEKARTEAARLGFQLDQNGEHRTMWIAVQNYLRNLNP